MGRLDFGINNRIGEGMREIKFRVWAEGRMHEDLDMVRPKDMNKVGYALMQYTGLKDKNGKEIYEGDFLKFPNNEFWTGAKVEWFDVELMLVKGDGCIELNHNDGMYIDRDSAEVIGNIYENPELFNQP